MHPLAAFFAENTADTGVIFFMCAAVFLAILRYGKSSAVSYILALYLGMLIFMSFPFLENLTILRSSEVQIALSHIALFFLGVFTIHLAIRRLIFTEFPDSQIMKYAQAIILSFFIIGLSLAFLYHEVPFSTLYDFGDSVDYLFSPTYFFWWLVAPFVILFVMSRR